ncbi:hypothetical protein GQ55_9G636100 [Panicum hallii var. hallii]|uniref:Uncharacterized protein n=1 Tax=Panicum hallii var. hallii TaxID=1504633 RepID=A0A2T7CIH1_9POAL|nr:hypothetical protein GQ55_9G636100 [Panicum hallii var. hallii]
MMYPTGPQHHGPRKCYTPRCRNHHSHHSPHEGRRRHRAGGRENDVSASGQPKREGPAARLFRHGSREGQATAPQARKPRGSKSKQPRQSQVSTETRHRMGIATTKLPELSAEHPDGYICSSGYPIPHAHRLFLHLLELRISQPT